MNRRKKVQRKTIALIVAELFLATSLSPACLLANQGAGRPSNAQALEDRSPWTASRAGLSAPGFDLLRQRASKDGAAKGIEELYFSDEELETFRRIDEKSWVILWHPMELATDENLHTRLRQLREAGADEEAKRLYEAEKQKYLEREGATEVYHLYNALSREDQIRFYIYSHRMLNWVKRPKDREHLVGILKKEEIAEHLVALVHSPDYSTKKFAAFALGDIHPSPPLLQKAIAQLEKIIGTSASRYSTLRGVAVHSLGLLDPARPDAYFETLAAEREDIREAARDVLSWRAEDRERAQDGGVRERVEELNRMREQYRKAAEEFNEMRTELSRANGQEAEWLRRAIQQKENEALYLGRLIGREKDEAVDALGRLGADVVPELLELLKGEEAFFQTLAVRALVKIGPPSVPGLITGSQHQNWFVQAISSWALGEIGDPSAVPPLLKNLKEGKSWEVRSPAAWALGTLAGKHKVTSPAVVEGLTLALKEEKEEAVRKAIQWALDVTKGKISLTVKKDLWDPFAQDGGEREEGLRLYHLNSLVEQAVTYAKHLHGSGEKGMEITAEITEEPLYVENRDADEELFLPYSIIDELVVENPVKYTRAKFPEGGGQIHVSLTREGDEAVLRVKDNGLGIPDDEQKKVFDYGYRATNVRDRLPSPNYGDGKGLNLAWHTVVDQYQGKIGLESKLDEETLVEVRLPLAQKTPSEVLLKGFFGPEGTRFEKLTRENQGNIFKDETNSYVRQVFEDDASTVVLKEGRTIGYQLNFVGKDEKTEVPYLYIGFVFVNEEYRREGLARALIYQMAKEAIARGIPELRMDVHVSTPGMFELADRTGFQKEGNFERGMQRFTAEPNAVIRKLLTDYLDYLRTLPIHEIAVQTEDMVQITPLEKAVTFLEQGRLDFDLQSRKWVLASSSRDGADRMQDFEKALEEFLKGEQGLERWEAESGSWDRAAAEERYESWRTWIEFQQNRFIDWGRGSVVPESAEAAALEPLMEEFLKLMERTAALFEKYRLDVRQPLGLSYIQAGNFDHFLLGKTDRAAERYSHAPNELREEYFGRGLFGAIREAWEKREAIRKKIRKLKNRFAVNSVRELDSLIAEARRRSDLPLEEEALDALTQIGKQGGQDVREEVGKLLHRRFPLAEVVFDFIKQAVAEDTPPHPELRILPGIGGVTGQNVLAHQLEGYLHSRVARFEYLSDLLHRGSSVETITPARFRELVMGSPEDLSRKVLADYSQRMGTAKESVYLEALIAYAHRMLELLPRYGSHHRRPVFHQEIPQSILRGLQAIVESDNIPEEVRQDLREAYLTASGATGHAQDGGRQTTPLVLPTLRQTETILFP